MSWTSFTSRTLAMMSIIYISKSKWGGGMSLERSDWSAAHFSAATYLSYVSRSVVYCVRSVRIKILVPLVLKDKWETSLRICWQLIVLGNLHSSFLKFPTSVGEYNFHFLKKSKICCAVLLVQDGCSVILILFSGGWTTVLNRQDILLYIEKFRKRLANRAGKSSCVGEE